MRRHGSVAFDVGARRRARERIERGARQRWRPRGRELMKSLVASSLCANSSTLTATEVARERQRLGVSLRTTQAREKIGKTGSRNSPSLWKEIGTFFLLLLNSFHSGTPAGFFFTKSLAASLAFVWWGGSQAKKKVDAIDPYDCRKVRLQAVKVKESLV